ncbi:MAG: YdcF family protein [Bacteroidaceae bacterium]|nr:YdcF family protein [Bacteroidaceae bacterium]
MKKTGKIIIGSLGLFILFCAILMLVCDRIIVSHAKGKVFSELDSIAPTEWGLLLGTTPQTRIGRRQNLFFKYRIDAAVQLYEIGLVECFLISGDENSLDGVNEPQCMKDSLVARGVPAGYIYLDGKGFRTLDSVVRTSKIYGIKSFTIISQQFHNERALYLAEHLNLDVEKIQAYNAVSPVTGWSFLTYIREYFARVKMIWDILTNKQPKELGEPVNLKDEKYSFYKPWLVENSVIAHDEKDTIVGNFTGMGIDTLFVVGKDDSHDYFEGQTFYLKSTNKSLPPLNLGLHSGVPELVNEGDLDGNGTIEVGYLPVWTTSQWRTYQVLTFKDGKWCNLIDPSHEFMNTGELIRASGKEIVEPTGKKGCIKVNYETQGVGPMIKDTIVKPDYSAVEEEE